MMFGPPETDSQRTLLGVLLLGAVWTTEEMDCRITKNNEVISKMN